MLLAGIYMLLFANGYMIDNVSCVTVQTNISLSPLHVLSRFFSNGFGRTLTIKVNGLPSPICRKYKGINCSLFTLKRILILGPILNY